MYLSEREKFSFQDPDFEGRQTRVSFSIPSLSKLCDLQQVSEDVGDVVLLAIRQDINITSKYQAPDGDSWHLKRVTA